jgi:hypothetical protein
MQEKILRKVSNLLPNKQWRHSLTIDDDLMIETIAILLVALWLLGFLTSTTFGGLIHLLLVIAVIAIVFRLISGRRI